MKGRDAQLAYNERLFSGGLRGYVHNARFRLLADLARRHRIDCRRVLELGCYDGKTIRWLPEPPERYIGFDADWEGGLALARAAWADRPAYRFAFAERPEDIDLAPGERFGLTVVMETLEHVPPELVEPYLARLAAHTEGHLLVTVPNEKGLFFLAKWLAKKLMGTAGEPYTAAELVNATLGRLDRVPRSQHKGFDHDVLRAQVARHFEVIEVTGHPLRLLPHRLCAGIGILARSRPPAGRAGP